MIQIFYSTLVINLLSQFTLYFFNNKKINATNPIIYKIVSYFFLFNINIISFYIMIFIFNSLNNIILLSYTLTTFALFIIHFILDEDWILRFEKEVNLILIIIITIILYSIWYFLVI